MPSTPEPLAAAPADESLTNLGNLEVLRLDTVRAGADAVVTTRLGGVSEGAYATLNLGDHVGDDAARVAENRNRLADALGVPRTALKIAQQVHGRGVAALRGDDEPGEADVLVTDDPDVVLCLLVADCAPLVLVDPRARVLAVAHAGWRGTAADVAGAAVVAMASLGGSPRDCLAVVGPCISGAAYEVGDDVVEAFVAAGVGWAVGSSRGRRTADLRRANAAQLAAAGVPARQIAVSSLSTDGGVRFFSDRAQRPCGRVALAARLSSVHS